VTGGVVNGPSGEAGVEGSADETVLSAVDDEGFERDAERVDKEAGSKG
jgi:hypothetical protein